MKPQPNRLLAFAAAAVAVPLGWLTFAAAQDLSGISIPVAADSPLLLEPADDAERLEAALLMLRMGRGGLARRYVAQILDGGIADEELLELRDRFGPGAFVTLSRAEAIEPLGRRLLDRVDRAFRESESDETRVNRLIALLDGNAGEAEQAANALIAGGLNTTPTLINGLVAPRSNTREDRLIEILAAIGPKARGPVEAATVAEDGLFVARLISVLGKLGAAGSRPVLLALAADPERPAGTRRLAADALDLTEAEARDRHRLADELVAEALDRHAASLAGDEAERDDYVWDAGSRKLRVEATSAAARELDLAERYVSAAARIAPQNRRVAPAEIAVGCRRLVYEGREADAFDELVTAGIDVLGEAASVASTLGDARSSALAIRTIGALMPRSAIDGPTGRRVLDALDSGDPLLRLAAAEALVAAKPDRPHRNASAVPRVFARGLTAGEGLAVLIDADASRASLVSGYFNELGFVTRAAATGRDGFAAAADEGFTDLIAIHVGARRPDLRTLLNAFRADARTKSTPIVVYGDSIYLDRVSRLASRFEACEFVILTPVRDAFLRQAREVIGTTGRAASVSDIDPDDYRDRCLAGLRRIVADGLTGVYPLDGLEDRLEIALLEPDLEDAAAATLAGIPSVEAQRVLAEDVLRRRKSGPAEALVGHIRAYGPLLPRTTVEALVAVADEPGTTAEFRRVMAAFRGMLVTASSR